MVNISLPNKFILELKMPKIIEAKANTKIIRVSHPSESKLTPSIKKVEIRVIAIRTIPKITRIILTPFSIDQIRIIDI